MVAESALASFFDSFFVYVTLVCTVVAALDWFRGPAADQETRDKLENWWLHITDYSYAAIVRRTLKFSTTALKGLREFAAGPLLRTLSFAILPFLPGAIVLLVLIPIEIVGSIFTDKGIHPQLTEVSNYGTIMQIYLYYLKMCLGIFFGLSLMNIAWQISWRLTVYFVIKARRKRSFIGQLQYLIIDILIAYSVVGFVTFTVEDYLISPKDDVYLWFVGLALPGMAIASLLPTGVHLCITLGSVLSRFAQSVFGPVVAQLILRITETKKGVYSQIVLAIGIGAKLVQEMAKLAE